MTEANKKTSDAVSTKNTSKTVTEKIDSTAAPSEKTEVKQETNKVETVKASTKKKAQTKRSPKKGAKRGPKPVSERTVELQVQFGGKEDVTYTSLVNNVKGWWKEQGKRETSLKSINIYLKPEDFMAYCVISDKIEYNIDLSDWN